jgi:1-acyl-sn-glycerol-3-phosphate acyltransferase
VSYASLHLAATLACLGLWLTGRGGHAEAHYGVMRRFVSGIHDAIARVARVSTRTVESAAAERVLSARDRPLLVLSVHAGEGDSLLVLHDLLCRHGRRPRIVMHEALRLDPLIDVLGERLPNRFVDPRGGDTEVEIAAMSGGLRDDDAVLIFPEGGNATEEHRRRGIERLERAGHHEEAAWARALRHLSAPRPGGTLAALEASTADVVFMAHSGFPSTLRDAWKQLPHPRTVTTRLWHEPRSAIPAGRDERIDWLFAWWRTLDGWVDAERGSAVK